MGGEQRPFDGRIPMDDRDDRPDLSGDSAPGERAGPNVVPLRRRPDRQTRNPEPDRDPPPDSAA